MTFGHIVGKNLKYNFGRFLSYLFVNSFVVAVLFLYGSLLFNEILARNGSFRAASAYIQAAAYAILLFSIVFVAYTGIYFVKSRSREFALYLTLGMTDRDLIRMIHIESLAIVAGSMVFGMLSGLLLSKLFYMILGRILGFTGFSYNDIYYIDYRTFLLSFGVFILVFLFNMLFTNIFIRRLSIVQMMKSSSTKGVSKSRPVVGAVAAVVCIFSTFFLHEFLARSEWARGITTNYPVLIPLLTFAVVIVSLYFVIAFGIDILRYFSKRVPAFYNRNILTFGSLSHRFFSYKVTLYIVSLLIFVAIYFMGMGISIYTYNNKTIEEFVPYDFMIETSGNMNNISPDEIKKLVGGAGGVLDTFSALKFASCQNYRNTKEGFVNYYLENYKDSMVISESEFNRHMGLHIDVKPDELLLVYNSSAKAQEPIDFDTVITIEPWREGVTHAEAFGAKSTDMDTFVRKLGNIRHLVYSREKTRSMYAPFIDSYGNIEYAGVLADVVDDKVYAELKAKTETAYLFNLKSGHGKKVFNAILDGLRKINGADESLWQSSSLVFGAKDDITNLRPIYKQERFDMAFGIGGFTFFAFSFIGFLFLLSSGIVLYYKIVTDIDEEKEQIVMLKRIGINGKECRRYLTTHLAIIFFTPFVIGAILGTVYMHAELVFTPYVGYMMSFIWIIIGVVAILDVLLYLTLRKRFFRGVEV
ncbi:ABC transporter permease [Clostridium kluyveri]|uniref:ABC transporter permease n=1 Tax=Clostridium kluyveri TaxID=1534 RepID=A0A1L5FCX9_CLOKL|nr:ABC transporter permease [Clostridium kluyveri]APM40872.1 ABC transporter permease [Clostridium kluyveri]UZQ48983.1 ABC transporter permease [Clostridium kluyveri]